MSESPGEIHRVLQEVVLPLVRADGGKLYLVAASADEISLHLGGSFSGCPGNTLAIRRVIEPALLAVAPRARVIITAGAIVPPGSAALPPSAP
jgi:Fe-S cluster biogenesis protein NfuA